VSFFIQAFLNPKKFTKKFTAPVSHTTPPKSQSSHYPCLKIETNVESPKEMPIEVVPVDASGTRPS